MSEPQNFYYRVLRDVTWARSDCMRMLGIEPNTVYLGKREIDALVSMPGLMQGDPSGKDQLWGMDLFKVDAPSHLAVAYVYRGKQ